MSSRATALVVAQPFRAAPCAKNAAIRAGGALPRLERHPSGVLVWTFERE
jgi:hypothetical protein